MELTSKQRAQLRSLATNLDTIVHVGKDGIGDNLIKQVNDALEARELIKGRVLEQRQMCIRDSSCSTGCSTTRASGRSNWSRRREAYEHRYLRRHL